MTWRGASVVGRSLAVLAGVLGLAAGGRAEPPADLPYAPKSAKVWTTADPHGFAALKWVINNILIRPTYAATSNLNANALGASGAVWRAEGTAELGASGTLWRAERVIELGSSGAVWRVERVSELGSSGLVWRADGTAELGASGTVWRAERIVELGASGDVWRVEWTTLVTGLVVAATQDLSAAVISIMDNPALYTNRWEDLRTYPNGMNLPGAPSAASLEVNSGPSADQIALRFTSAGTQEAGSEYQLPHAWVTNTTVYPHFHYHYNTAGPHTSVWQFAHSWANIGATFPSSTVVVYTNIDLTGGQYKHQLLNIPTNGVSGAGKNISSVFRWRLSRLGGDAADTGGDIDVVSSDLHHLTLGLPAPFPWLTP